jgi:transposase
MWPAWKKPAPFIRWDEKAQKTYPEVELLKQVKNVGELIVLTYVLNMDDPHRFRKSREAGCFVGCSRGGGTLGRANHRCTSARKATDICGPAGAKGALHLGTFWGRR